jgi:glycosyltransferase involved in cell wall biosynthesis
VTGIVFWQNIPSIHQAPLLEALARIGHDVTLVAEAALPESRERSGWPMPDFRGVRVIQEPDEVQRRALARDTEARVHIFSGLGSYPATYSSFLSLVTNKGSFVEPVAVGLYLEPFDDRGLAGKVRAARYRRRTLAIRNAVDFVLATGPRAGEQYLRAGFNARQVFPFAYFSGTPAATAELLVEPKGAAQPRPHRFGYVGQLIRRKRVDLLLRALAGVSDRDWRLEVVGSGPEQGALRALASQLGLNSRVAWIDKLPNSSIHEFMSNLDTLVLPSEFDGWGTVVNESLSVGTPVIASSATGASELVHGLSTSWVFRVNDIGGLRSALQDSMSSRIVREHRQSLRDWAARAISADCGARYLMQIWEHRMGNSTTARPPAPWRRN